MRNRRVHIGLEGLESWTTWSPDLEAVLTAAVEASLRIREPMLPDHPGGCCGEGGGRLPGRFQRLSLSKIRPAARQLIIHVNLERTHSPSVFVKRLRVDDY